MQRGQQAPEDESSALAAGLYHLTLSSDRRCDCFGVVSAQPV